MIVFPRSKEAMEQSLPRPCLGTGFLNLHWILQGVDAMLAAHSNLQRLLESPQISGRMGRDLACQFVDDSARVLETVNAVRKSLSLASQHKMKIKYGLHLVEKDWSSREELEVARAKIYLEAVIGNVEKESDDLARGAHTESWRAKEDESVHKKLFKLAKKRKNEEVAKFASKVVEANFVSSLVLAALLAALDSRTALAAAPSVGKSSSQELRRSLSLWDELKDEAEARRREKRSCCSSALLEGIWGCLRQIVSMLEKKSRDEGDDVRMKQLLQLAGKKLEYIDSGFQILEEQMADLFSRLVVNRNKVLSLV